MKYFLEKILQHQDLTMSESHKLMFSLMSGNNDDIEIASFLVAIRSKGETVDEITGFVRAMREKMIKLHTHSPAIDMCGTGGDASGTFNISTAASFITAGAGVKVAKHGNRSMSSKSGSADVLQALGISINLDKETTSKNIEEIGLGFIFAPDYHPAMRYAMKARKSLGIRTIFNLLGPLCNPAGVKSQSTGIFNPNMTNKVASVLKNLGSENIMVFSGLDGLDEISTNEETKISEMKNKGEILTYNFSYKELQIKQSKITDLNGGSPKKNATIIKKILEGEKGPKRDITLLNAAAGIFVGKKNTSFEESFHNAIDSLDSLAALNVLKKLQS